MWNLYVSKSLEWNDETLYHYYIAAMLFMFLKDFFYW